MTTRTYLDEPLSELHVPDGRSRCHYAAAWTLFAVWVRRRRAGGWGLLLKFEEAERPRRDGCYIDTDGCAKGRRVGSDLGSKVTAVAVCVSTRSWLTQPRSSQNWRTVMNLSSYTRGFHRVHIGKAILQAFIFDEATEPGAIEIKPDVCSWFYPTKSEDSRGHALLLTCANVTTSLLDPDITHGLSTDCPSPTSKMFRTS
jgi:hypothetical protein